MSAELVSIIIPSYNHAEFIVQAVKSVLEQTWSNLELIVIDDGSQDASLEILRQLENHSNQKMKVISQENQGAHAAINRGLKMAQGSILAILNSDDYYHPQRLEKLVPLLKNSHNDKKEGGLIGSYLTLVDDSGTPVGEKHGFLDCSPWQLTHPERSFRAGTDLDTPLLTENYLSTTSNFVFTQACFKETGEFRPLRYTHDWDFALRVIKNGYPLQLFPAPLVCYRLHGRNTIRENQAAMIFEICWILAVHLPFFINSPTFKSTSLKWRIDQLLNSIYTYQCDRVLTVMLLQNLHADEEAALALLRPEDDARQMYLAFIQEQINTNIENSFPPVAPNRPLLRRIARKIYYFPPVTSLVKKILDHD
jgi:glycosyltransferase involved in cell wall biosynthesis